MAAQLRLEVHGDTRWLTSQDLVDELERRNIYVNVVGRYETRTGLEFIVEVPRDVLTTLLHHPGTIKGLSISAAPHAPSVSYGSYEKRQQRPAEQPDHSSPTQHTPGPSAQPTPRPRARKRTGSAVQDEQAGKPSSLHAASSQHPPLHTTPDTHSRPGQAPSNFSTPPAESAHAPDSRRATPRRPPGVDEDWSRPPSAGGHFAAREVEPSHDRPSSGLQYGYSQGQPWEHEHSYADKDAHDRVENESRTPHQYSTPGTNHPGRGAAPGAGNNHRPYQNTPYQPQPMSNSGVFAGPGSGGAAGSDKLFNSTYPQPNGSRTHAWSDPSETPKYGESIAPSPASPSAAAVSPPSADDQAEVLVTGVPCEKWKLVPMYFKRRMKASRMTGHDNLQMKELKCETKVVIAFPSKAAADMFVTESKHETGGYAFTVSSFDTASAENAVHMCNLSQCDKDFIEMVICDELGDDPIRSIDINRQLRQAVIEFRNEGDADKVSALEPQALELLGTDVKVAKVCLQLTLIAGGLNSLPEKSVDMYFRSGAAGGSKLVQVKNRQENGVALILCPDKYVAASLTDREHCLLNNILTVRPFSLEAMQSILAPTNETAGQVVPCEEQAVTEQTKSTSATTEYMDDHLLVLDIPGDISLEQGKLKFYMAGTARIKLSDVHPPPEFRFDRALFRFRVPIDFDLIESSCADSPFDEVGRRYLRVRRVKSPCSLYAKFPGERDEVESYAWELLRTSNPVAVTKQSRDSVRVTYDDPAAAKTAKTSSAMSGNQLQCSEQFEGFHFPAREDDERKMRLSSMPEKVEQPIPNTKAAFLKSCKPFKEMLVKELHDIHAEFTINGDHIVVRPGSKALYITHWVEAVNAALAHAFKLVQENKVAVPVEYHDMLLEWCSETLLPHNTEVVANAEEACLHVFSVENDASQFVSLLTKQAKSTTKKGTSDIGNVKEDVLELLKMAGCMENIQTATRVESIVEEETKPGIFKLTISGQEKRVTDASNQLKQAIKEVKTTVLTFENEHVHQLMRSEAGLDYIRQCLEGTKCRLRATKGQSQRTKVEVLYNEADEYEYDQAVEDLHASLTFTEIDMDKSELTAVNRLDLKSAILESRAELEARLFQVRTDKRTSSIHICGEKSAVSECEEEVRVILESRGRQTVVFKLRASQFQFMKEHYGEQLETLKAKSSTVHFADRNNRIELKGPSEDVEAAHAELKTLAARYHVQKFPMAMPGLKDHLNNAEYKAQVVDEGRNSNVDVDIMSRSEAEMESEEESSDDGEADEVPNGLSKHNQGSAQLMATYSLPAGKQLLVYKGDITKFRCSAMTNACNERLQHGAGVAAAICRAGGPDIQRDSSRHVRQVSGGQLSVSAVYRTRTVGRLPCKVLLHAVGPRWDRHQQQKCRSQLAECMQNVLQESQDLDTVAVPAISSLIFGFPDEICASELANATVSWLSENPACRLKKVVFIDLRPEILELLSSELAQCCEGTDMAAQEMLNEPPSHQRPKPKSRKKSSAAPENPGIFNKVKMAAAYFLPQKAAQPTRICKLSPNGKGLTTPEGVAIEVQQGDISLCQADAIVNSCGSSLQMNGAGPTAAAISRVAGSRLQKECSKIVQREGPVMAGTFKVTKGYNLQASHVYHAVLPNYSGHDSEQVLETAAINIMRDSNQKGLASLALPSLGAGNSRYPPGRVAEILIGSAVKFSKSTSVPRLRKIILCIFDPNMHSIFLDEISTTCDNGAGDGDSSPDSSSSSDQYSDEDSQAPLQNRRATLGAQSGQHRSRTQQPGPRKRTTSNRPATPPLHNVTVAQGDITGEQVDAIVITAMSGLDMSKANMSKNVARVAGPGVQGELNTINGRGKKKTNPGQVIKTSAGSLHSKYILHAVMEYAEKTSSPTDFLKAIVTKCLDEASKLRCTSIAIPALGAGGLNYSVQDCVQATFAAIEAFDSQAGSSTVQTIRLVMYDQRHVPPFQAHLDQVRSASGVTNRPATRTQRSLVNKPSSNAAAAAAAACITTKVKQADIATENVAAIVTTVMPDLQMKSAGMSKAILAVAGDSVQKSLDGRKAKLKTAATPGQVYDTSGGNLKNIKHILHAVMNYASKVANQKQFIEDVVLGCLEKASQLNCPSIAIPALGAGGLGFDVTHCADGTMNAIRKFSAQSMARTSLKSILLVVYAPNHLQPFQLAVQSTAQAMVSVGAPPPSHPTTLQDEFEVTAETISRQEEVDELDFEEDDDDEDDALDQDLDTDPRAVRKQDRLDRMAYKNNSEFEEQEVIFKLTGPDSRSTRSTQKRIQSRISSTLKSSIFQHPDMELLSASDEMQIELGAENRSVLLRYKDTNTIVLHGNTSDMALVQAQIAEKCNSAQSQLRLEESRQREAGFERLANKKQKEAEATKRKAVEYLKKKKDPFPPYWTASGKERYQLVDLQSTDREYKEAVELFRKTATNNITRVQRVENPNFYGRFKAVVSDQKNKEQHCSGKCDIKKLWHGTVDDSVEMITNTGWERNFAAGRVGAIYGRGNYFARDACYSVNYAAPPTGSSTCRMILAHVAVLDMVQGHDKLFVPPWREDGNHEKGKVSVAVDNVSNPSIFVTYMDGQAYPAYLVHFTK